MARRRGVVVATPTFLQYADMVSSGGGPTLMTWRTCGKSGGRFFNAATKERSPSINTFFEKVLRDSKD